MRPIDADYLKEEMDAWWCPDMTVGEIWNVIDNAPTVSNWISVKDKLPENEKAVICYTPCDGYMFVGFYRTYESKGYKWSSWQIITAMRSTRTITKKVTHWMPLPEPPKEDDV